MTLECYRSEGCKQPTFYFIRKFLTKELLILWASWPGRIPDKGILWHRVSYEATQSAVKEVGFEDSSASLQSDELYKVSTACEDEKREIRDYTKNILHYKSEYLA